MRATETQAQQRPVRRPAPAMAPDSPTATAAIARSPHRRGDHALESLPSRSSTATQNAAGSSACSGTA